MTNSTYYLLRKKGTALGDGPYLGVDTNGHPALVPELIVAKRFNQLAEAEQHSAGMAELGEFEIEVRTSA